jgi:hypothetical protein
MKILLSFLFFCYLVSPLGVSQISIQEVGQLPEKVANNAVCEGFIDEVPFLFSFGGIDSTKEYSGIHLRSFRFNIESNESIQLADLPDTLGKVAAGASRIGDIIYVIGGYHVFENETELSSTKVHRYDILNNQFLNDGADIPIAIDDQVQAVWRDSLIYVITGWSDMGNIPDVQIYNPALDQWMSGTPTPNSNSYKSFGASGVIVEDTIYYFGGATSGFGFGPQSQYRKGIINSDDPTEIDWSFTLPDNSVKAYRAASTISGENLYWIGGSANTYNYDGIAYNGTGGVPTSKKVLYTRIDTEYWNEMVFDEIPMDLRGIAEISEEQKFIAGGMLSSQTVSDKVYKIEIQNVVGTQNDSSSDDLSVFPNPILDKVFIEWSGHKDFKLAIYDFQGHKVLTSMMSSTDNLYLNVEGLKSGMYVIRCYDKEETAFAKIIKY